jgi:hypothetical protein
VLLHSRPDHVRPPEQNGLRNLFVHEALRCAEDFDLFPFGKDDALPVFLRPDDDRAHDFAAATEARFELVAIRIEVDLDSGDARLHRRFGHGRRLPGENPRIERTGNDVVGTESHGVDSIGPHDGVGNVLLGEIGEGVGGGELHLHVDRARADVEGAPEDEGEAEDVVHLVRKIGAPRRHHQVVPDRHRVVPGDLGIGVSHGHDERIAIHRGHHRFGDGILHRDAEEDVRPFHRFFESAVPGLEGVALLVRVHALGAALVDDALGVGHEDVLVADAHALDEVGARDSRRASAVHHHFDAGSVLSGELEPVQERRSRDDGRPVLVVVEDGNIHLPLERLFDVETVGGLDVLEVDAAERRLERLHDSVRSSGSGVASSMSEDVDVANLLKDLPSITGFAARGPMFPRPSTAVPFETTATRFPLVV